MKQLKGGVLVMAGDFIRGMVIGVAQIIPGVSGGTLALILGIYERFIGALNAVSGCAVAFLSWMKGFKQESKQEFIRRFKAIEWLFLIFLAAGMFAAIIAVSGLISRLLEFHRAPTYGLFFGLIIASVIVPWSRMERRRIPELVSFLVGLLLLLWLSGLGKDLPVRMEENRHQTVSSSIVKPAKIKLFAKAYTKSGSGYVLNTALSDAEKEGVSKILQKSGKPALWFLFIAGAVSVSAMILPGLSGSFVLLIMGCYGYILSMIALLKTMNSSAFLPLGIFGLGLIAGLFSFARLMEFLLEKYHSITMAFLIGLMLGSLRKIFPFSSGMEAGQLFVVLAAIFAGAVLVIFLHVFSNRKSRN